MRPIDSLKLWFERDIRQATWREVETLVQQPDVCEIRFSTEYFTYTVTADLKHGESFLGGTCFDRQRRTNRDLPDGMFSSETWAEIVEAVMENELTSERPLPGRLF